jgi:hypothetical protein
MVAVPLTTLQVPVPTTGLFPDRLTEVSQVVWFVPALAILGLASLVIVTVLSLDGQLPLLTVHFKM